MRQGVSCGSGLNCPAAYIPTSAATNPIKTAATGPQHHNALECVLTRAMHAIRLSSVTLVERCPEESARRYHTVIHILRNACLPKKSTHPIFFMKCQYCDHVSTRMDHLREHEMLHTGTRRHKCRFCLYASITSSDMKKHEWIHLGTRPYKCTQCSYATRRTDTLKNHLRSKHGIVKNSAAPTSQPVPDGTRDPVLNMLSDVASVQPILWHTPAPSPAQYVEYSYGMLMTHSLTASYELVFFNF